MGWITPDEGWPMGETGKAKVILVKDDPVTVRMESQCLQQAGYAVDTATSAAEALQKLSREKFDLIILDPRLGGQGDGLRFHAHLRASGLDVPPILVTAPGLDATLIQAMQPGKREPVPRPADHLSELRGAVDSVLRQAQTEQQLAQSEAQLAGIIKSAKDAIIIAESDRKISLFNKAAEQMFRCPASKAIGKPMHQFIPRDFEGDMPESESFTQIVRSGNRGVRADGEVFPLEASVSRAEVGGRKFYAIVVRDISERKRAEDELKKSEERYRRLFEDALTANFVSAIDGALLACNSAFAQLFGYASVAEALQSKTVPLYETPEKRAELLDLLRAKKKLTHQEIELRRIDGKVVHVLGNFAGSFDARGALAQITGYLLDNTEQKKLEEQLRQAQKLEAVGKLAGGVAHDFNNLLTVISGYSEILFNNAAVDDPMRELIVEVRKAAERAGSLTRQLLAFSRKQMLQPQVVDLNTLVHESEKMLRRLIGEDIDLSTRLDPAVGKVKVDPGQIEQVVMNLAVNARDAMPTGGQLTIETQNVELDAGYAAQRADVRPGPYVLLAVTDTGCGMSPETRTHIFEPFFTTKEAGKGTGLGLSTVFGIIKQSDGHIEVYSEPGQGTTFKIYLPRVEDAQEVHKSAPAAVGEGTETILLAEDDSVVRSLAALALRSYGYTVLEARDGVEALQICRTHPDPIHLVISDVVMPRMSGRQLAGMVSSLRPQTRVLYLSGYTDDAVVRHGLVQGEVPFLQKPFTPNILARKIREVLEGPPPVHGAPDGTET
jgi:two-component system cell cycle sensor histidine kinase/response regulator CckA